MKNMRTVPGKEEGMWQADPDDVITHVNGFAVNTVEEVICAVSLAKNKDDVQLHVEAHSGAVIGALTGPEVDPRTNYTLDGEISRAEPTINDQIENALRSLADPSQIDLVLVNGCINDVDSRRLLNAANTPDTIAASPINRALIIHPSSTALRALSG
jgi:hypothetical protein